MPKHRRSRSTQSLIKLAQRRISGCAECVPSLAHDDIDDALRPLRLNDRERHRLFHVLQCPSCESEIGAWDTVRAYEPRELREIARLERWDKDYRRDLERFDEYITKYPALGALHDVGKSLATAVQRARIVTLEANTLWFRATRAQEVTDPGFVHRGAGRFHGPGQRALYVADDPAGATVEILRDDPTEEGTIWIKEFLMTQPLRVIDLSISILGTHKALPLLLEGVRFTIRRAAAAGAASDEYHITRYVADLIRKRGVDGLVHTSSRAHPFRDDVFSRNMLLTRAVAFQVEADETHEWRRTEIPPFRMPQMEFDPPIPIWWWERMRHQRERAAAALRNICFG